MGTSSAFGGPSNGTPLVPTWLEPDAPIFPSTPEGMPPDSDEEGNEKPSIPTQTPVKQPVIEPIPLPNRFTTARTNLTKFASSGGSNSASLGRALSDYVSKSSGGARQATRRMGSSRKTASRLFDFLSEVVERGGQEALRALHLESLVGLPINEVFVGMIDYVCPDGGNIDEGIARDAFIETIAELTKNGITDLDTLNIEQMETVFELYITHSIQNRLYNDIGTKAIHVPSDITMASQIQAQMYDFIRRGVTDVLAVARKSERSLTKDSVKNFVDQVYENSFEVLQRLGDTEEA